MFEQVDYKNLELNPFTTIGEDAMLITVGTSERWNTMAASWGTMGYLWNKPISIVFIRPSRYTYSFVEKAEGFTISFFPPAWRSAIEFCGTHSGRDTDKIQATGLKPVELESGRITFEQANLVLSCTTASRVPFEVGQFILPSIKEHYAEGDYHTMYVGFLDQVLAQEN